jgi:DNA-binding protein YbaB
MLDNLFGNLQQQQEEIQRKLAQTFVQAESGDGAIVVNARADSRIENIKIDGSKLDTNDLEQLEDLLLVAVNRALELARQKAAAETNKLIKGLLPGGMEEMFKQ